MRTLRFQYCTFLLVILLGLSSVSSSLAQNNVIDSLKTKLSSALEDSNKVKLLINLAYRVQFKGKYSEALEYGESALHLAEKIAFRPGQARSFEVIGAVQNMQGNYSDALKNMQRALEIALKDSLKQLIGNAYTDIGNVHRNTGEYSEAIRSALMALHIWEQLKNKRGIADLHNNLAIIQVDLGNYPEALKENLASLKIREELKDSENIAASHNNLGVVYEDLGNYSESLSHHRQALKFRMKKKDELGMVQSYNNIANIFNDRGEYEDALRYNLLSLEIHQKIGDKKGLGDAYNNVGITYKNLNDYSKALENYKHSKEIRQEIRDLDGIAQSFNNLGEVYIVLKKLTEAQNCLDSSEQIYLTIHRKPGLVETYSIMVKLDSAKGDFKQGFYHYKKYLLYHDSIYNEENSQKATRAEMNFEFDKKQALAKAEQDKTIAVAAAESRKEQIILVSICTLLVIILFFASFVYRSYLKKKRINHRLQIQKKHIDESIRYAQRIQEAILPAELFQSGEVTDYFLFYLPKDVVSGDFYWRYQVGKELFFAIVDCTGHGVPGAMMSMLGYDLLEYAVKEKRLREPGNILNMVNKQIIEKLKGSDMESATDGMDLTLCRLNLNTGELVYAGAKNDLFVFSGNQLQILPVTKCSIGYSREMRYTQKTIILKKTDEVFLMTDGYCDQKGGPEKKKFMLRKLKVLLQEISSFPCDIQQQKISEAYEAWKGNNPQRDDILFLGFRM